MTEREQFEKAFPVPKGMAYAEKYHAYMRSGGDLETPKAIYYNESWQAWQAARATPALPQVPEGMAIVPVEPTPESIKYETEWSHKNHGDNSI